MALFDWVPATRGDLKKLETKMSTQQDQIDALNQELLGIKPVLESIAQEVSAVGDGVTGLETTVTKLQQQIADFQAASGVDLSAIQGTVSDLKAEVAGVKTGTDGVLAKLQTPPTPPSPTPAAAA